MMSIQLYYKQEYPETQTLPDHPWSQNSDLVLFSNGAPQIITFASTQSERYKTISSKGQSLFSEVIEFDNFVWRYQLSRQLLVDKV